MKSPKEQPEQRPKTVNCSMCGASSCFINGNQWKSCISTNCHEARGSPQPTPIISNGIATKAPIDYTSFPTSTIPHPHSTSLPQPCAMLVRSVQVLICTPRNSNKVADFENNKAGLKNIQHYMFFDIPVHYKKFTGRKMLDADLQYRTRGGQLEDYRVLCQRCATWYHGYCSWKDFQCLCSIYCACLIPLTQVLQFKFNPTWSDPVWPKSAFQVYQCPNMSKAMQTICVSHALHSQSLQFCRGTLQS